MSSISGDDDVSNTPQQMLDDFWENLITKKPGKVTNIFPPSLYANLLYRPHKPSAFQGRNAAESYETAAKDCRARVERIVRECHRTNEKYTDPDFDIEGDWKTYNCLRGLMNWYKTDEDSSSNRDGDLPKSIHRIDWIFEKPSFIVDGFNSSDVQQGANGDCWFLAAVATICSTPSLMHKVCVHRNEECGVYGFVFYRDGEWIWTVVDDNLYLQHEDFAAIGDIYDANSAKERKHRKNNQTGSDALYFASCSDQNETWLPLLEKAYAKVHGDYDAISGGYSGEGVEDLTGGVTTKVLTNRILSKERLWNELMEMNNQFLFSASSPSDYGDDSDSRKGLALGHAYSVIKAVEEEDEDGKKHRLVLIRNPWGKRSWDGIGEWNGAWSDGAKEWTPYWLNKLNYRFGDDGVFWMSYADFLTRFNYLERTRLFDKNWTVVQLWTSVSVAWVTGYLNTKFLVEVKKAGPTVFVLAQLDDRYFEGLQGKYKFDLHFLLQEEGAPAGEHLVRARGAWFGNRSISAEVDLPPGNYEVIPKIVADKDTDLPDVYDVVQKLANKNPQKLRQVGMNYDMAHAKGTVRLQEEERKKKEQKRKEAQEKKRKEIEEAEREKLEFEAWRKEKREREEKEKEKKEREEKEKEKKEREEKEKIEQAKGKGIGEKEGEKEKVEKKESSDQQDAKTDEEKAEPAKDAEKQNTLESGDSQTADGASVSVSDGNTDAPDSQNLPTDQSTSVEKAETQPNEAEDKEDSKANGEETSTRNRVVDAFDGPPPAALPPYSVYGDGPPPAPVPPPPPVDNRERPWNAVCVLGLRVYSKDPEVSIKLVKPKNAEEGAVLDADGSAPAGATM